MQDCAALRALAAPPEGAARVNLPGVLNAAPS